MNGVKATNDTFDAHLGVGRVWFNIINGVLTTNNQHVRSVITSPANLFWGVTIVGYNVSDFRLVSVHNVLRDV